MMIKNDGNKNIMKIRIKAGSDFFRFHNKVELQSELAGYLLNLVPESAVVRRHRFTTEELMNPNHQFKGNDAGRESSDQKLERVGLSNSIF
jgi:hypothetical protein